MADRTKWQALGSVVRNGNNTRILVADDAGRTRAQQTSLIAQVVREHNAHSKLVKLLKALAENCKGIHETDQATGIVWSSQIAKLLESADPT